MHRFSRKNVFDECAGICRRSGLDCPSRLGASRLPAAARRRFAVLTRPARSRWRAITGATVAHCTRREGAYRIGSALKINPVWLLTYANPQGSVVSLIINQ
jgi:hypothetical protein